MAHTLSWNAFLSVGKTVNFYDHKNVNILSPFVAESVETYVEEFKEFEDNNNVISNGRFDYHLNLVSNLSSYSEALNVKGNLGASIGVVGGEAKVKFSKTQSMTSNDTRLLIQSSISGKYVNNPNHFNLKINPIIKEEINSNKFKSFEDFKNKYGSHLIIGQIYGSESIHQMTYKYNEKTKHEFFSLKIRVKLKACGFHVHKKAKKYKHSSDLDNIDIITNYIPQYFPTYPTERLDLVDAINKDFIKLKNVNGDDDENIADNMNMNIYNLLNSNTKPTKFILIPIQYVKCIYDAITSIEITSIHLNIFHKLLNPLYFLFMELKQDLQNIKHEQKQLWLDNLEKGMNEIENMNEQDIISFIENYKQYIFNKQDNESDKEEITKELYQINQYILKIQFKEIFSLS